MKHYVIEDFGYHFSNEDTIMYISSVDMEWLKLKPMWYRKHLDMDWHLNFYRL